MLASIGKFELNHRLIQLGGERNNPSLQCLVVAGGESGEEIVLVERDVLDDAIRSAVRSTDFVAHRLEIIPDQATQLAVVIDDEHARPAPRCSRLAIQFVVRRRHGRAGAAVALSLRNSPNFYTCLTIFHFQGHKSFTGLASDRGR